MTLQSSPASHRGYGGLGPVESRWPRRRFLPAARPPSKRRAATGNREPPQSEPLTGGAIRRARLGASTNAVTVEQNPWRARHLAVALVIFQPVLPNRRQKIKELSTSTGLSTSTSTAPSASVNSVRGRFSANPRSTWRSAKSKAVPGVPRCVVSESRCLSICRIGRSCGALIGTSSWPR